MHLYACMHHVHVWCPWRPEIQIIVSGHVVLVQNVCLLQEQCSEPLNPTLFLFR